MLTFSQRLSREMAKVSRMTLPQLEAALAGETQRTVAELTALSLAKKAAEGGMDAVKMIRELTKDQPAEQNIRTVELKVVP